MGIDTGNRIEFLKTELSHRILHKHPDMYFSYKEFEIGSFIES